MGSSRKPDGAEPTHAGVVGCAEDVLRRWTSDGERIIVGLSGGIDSVVLLDIVMRLAPAHGWRVEALHVNHGLSPNADDWEQFCRSLCFERGIAFEARRVLITGVASIESQARDARYQVFAGSGGRLVALAHNRDDQAETILMRLLRGAGLRGLAGMPESRALARAGAAGDAPRLVRPLLGVSRDQIAAYARARTLKWIEDESNRNVRFTRNFLRHDVLPLLERRFPGARANLARAGEHLDAAAGLVEGIAEADLPSVANEHGLIADRLATLGPARAANVLRLALARRGEAAPSTQAMRNLLRQVFEAGSDRGPAIFLQTVVVRRFRGLITIHAVEQEPAGQAWRRIDWVGGTEQVLPDGTRVWRSDALGSGVSRDRLGDGVWSLRRRQGGERIRLHAAAPTRTLKNLFQELGVPPWDRTRMPLLYCNEQLVWIPMVGVACGFRAAPGEPGCEFRWERGHGDPSG